MNDCSTLIRGGTAIFYRTSVKVGPTISESYSIICIMNADDVDYKALRAEIAQAKRIAEETRTSVHCLSEELRETNSRVDRLENKEKTIESSLTYIMRYLRLNAEVSSSIKTTLKILIAIVSLFSGISSIMRFVQSFLL